MIDLVHRATFVTFAARSRAAGAAGTTVVRGNAAYGTAQPGQDYVYDLLGQKVAKNG